MKVSVIESKCYEKQNSVALEIKKHEIYVNNIYIFSPHCKENNAPPLQISTG
jgi:hypothetical protein